MSPIRLSDSELDAVFVAARPIPVDRRDLFLQQVASALQNCAEIGPGAVYRAIAAAQREFFDPPDLPHVPSRWDRDAPSFEISRRTY